MQCDVYEYKRGKTITILLPCELSHKLFFILYSASSLVCCNQYKDHINLYRPSEQYHNNLSYIYRSIYMNQFVKMRGKTFCCLFIMVSCIALASACCDDKVTDGKILFSALVSV